MRPNSRQIISPLPGGDKLAVGLKAAVLAALAVLAGCGNSQQQAGPPSVPVAVGKVVRETVPYEVNTIGTVEAYQTVAVNARVAGELVEVFFEEGQFVKQGEPLFRIDPAPYRAMLEGALAALARDSVRAANAVETVGRYAELIAKDYITRQQYDQMTADAEALKATVKADRAAVERARLELSYCLIRSPIDGRSGRLLVHQGNNIKANADDPLVVIHQIEPVYVGFTVAEQYLTQILEASRHGKLKVAATIPDTQGPPHSGALDFVDNVVDEATGTIGLKATFPNTDGLLWPGQFINVTLVLRQIENAVVVPARAVQTGQDGNFVYVVKPDGTAESRPVEVTYNQGQQSVIGKGLDSGETVVTDGQLRLYPGARVEIRDTLETNGAESR